jgi:hypothetical protein
MPTNITAPNTGGTSLVASLTPGSFASFSEIGPGPGLLQFTITGTGTWTAVGLYSSPDGVNLFQVPNSAITGLNGTQGMPASGVDMVYSAFSPGGVAYLIFTAVTPTCQVTMAGGSVTSTPPGSTVLNYSADNPLPVSVTVIESGGGTSSTFGAAFPAIGTAVGFQDPNGNMAAGETDASGNIYVNQGESNASTDSITAVGDTAIGATLPAKAVTIGISSPTGTVNTLEGDGFNLYVNPQVMGSEGGFQNVQGNGYYIVTATTTLTQSTPFTSAAIPIYNAHQLSVLLTVGTLGASQTVTMTVFSRINGINIPIHTCPAISAANTNLLCNIAPGAARCEVAPYDSKTIIESVDACVPCDLICVLQFFNTATAIVSITAVQVGI